MPISSFRKAQIEELAKKVRLMYKQGLSVRQIAPIVGKSKSWVQMKVKGLSTP